MTNTIERDTFEDALANGGVLSEDIRSDYSGRGMYGRVCIGVVVDGSSVPRVTAALISYAASLREETDECSDPEYDFSDEELRAQEDLADALDRLAESVSVDNMGLDMIVYFPGWEFSD